ARGAAARERRSRSQRHAVPAQARGRGSGPPHRRPCPRAREAAHHDRSRSGDLARPPVVTSCRGGTTMTRRSSRLGSLLLVATALAARPGGLEAQTCGEIGGDWCSQDGSCPAGRHSLGQTSDCRPCCQTNEPTGPSCGELGGNYCSTTAGCPAGYANLGATWDCTRCCLQGGAGMSGVYYKYSDGGTNFSYIWGRGITSSDYNTYGHQYREVTTLTSP